MFLRRTTGAVAFDGHNVPAFLATRYGELAKEADFDEILQGYFEV